MRLVYFIIVFFAFEILGYSFNSGQWRLDYTKVEVDIQSWGDYCGPTPSSYIKRENKIYEISKIGKDLVLKFKNKKTRTTQCLSPNPHLIKEYYTSSNTSWKTVCKTPPQESRQEHGTYIFQTKGENKLEYKEESRYNWKLKGDNCKLTRRITKLFVKIKDPLEPPFLQIKKRRKKIYGHKKEKDKANNKQSPLPEEKIQETPPLTVLKHINEKPADMPKKENPVFSYQKQEEQKQEDSTLRSLLLPILLVTTALGLLFIGLGISFAIKRKREIKEFSQLFIKEQDKGYQSSKLKSMPHPSVSFCPLCRREFEEGEFCAYDGTRLVPLVQESNLKPPLGMICPKCKRTFEPGSKFCPYDCEALVIYSLCVESTSKEFPLKDKGKKGKICPRCAARYDIKATFCGRDGSELVLVN
jgi:hypothetical protein